MLKRLFTAALIAASVLVPLAWADTLTTNLLLNKQTVGGNVNTWGTNLNSNFQLLDDKLGKVTTVNTTGGTTVLSSAEEIAQTIKVTGTLASNAILQFSGRGGTWVIDNGTAGAFTVTAKLSGQTGVEIEQGGKLVVYSDAVDIKNPIPVPETAIGIGSVVDFAGTTAPEGWLLAYGQAVSRTTYASLFAVIGTAFGTGDGSTTFNLPDLRGRVIAGDDNMGGTSANRLVDGTDSLDGDTLGDTGGVEFQTIATAELPSHTHAAGTYAVGAHTHDPGTLTVTSHTHGAGTYTISGSGSCSDCTGEEGNINGGGNATVGSNSNNRTVSITGTVNGGASGATAPTVGSGATGSTAPTFSGSSASTGSGTPIAVVQPTIILNKIIYTGI